MSRGKRTKSSNGTSSTSSASRGDSESAAAPLVKKMPTVAERMRAKAKTARSLLEDLAVLAKRTVAPQEIVEKSQALGSEIGFLQSIIGALDTSGWQPAKLVPLKDLAEGDAITVAPKHRETYSFVPGLADGTVKLVAGTIVRSSNGRILRVLLKRSAIDIRATPHDLGPTKCGSDGEETYPEAVYGFAPLAHLQRA